MIDVVSDSGRRFTVRADWLAAESEFLKTVVEAALGDNRTCVELSTNQSMYRSSDMIVGRIVDYLNRCKGEVLLRFPPPLVLNGSDPTLEAAFKRAGYPDWVAPFMNEGWDANWKESPSKVPDKKYLADLFELLIGAYYYDMKVLNSFCMCKIAEIIYSVKPAEINDTLAYPELLKEIRSRMSPGATDDSDSSSTKFLFDAMSNVGSSPAVNTEPRDSDGDSVMRAAGDNYPDTDGDDEEKDDK